MEDQFLTVAEVAELLKLNPQEVRNWIDRELPAVRVGARRVRIRRSELDRFLQSGSTSSATPDEPPDAQEDDMRRRWEQLGAALSESSTALAGDDRAGLVSALEAVADAASQLADALRGR